MNMQELEFNTADELFGLIKQINKEYYEPFKANILFLEELADKIYTAYLIELRDASSHLVRVFDDIHTQKGRKTAQTHLHFYVDHLQNGLLDTFRKITDMEWKSITKSIPTEDLNAIRNQTAQRISQLRIMGENNSVDQRIKGYQSLLKYFSEIRKKFSSKTIKPGKQVSKKS
jgi:hypothetical protein